VCGAPGPYAAAAAPDGPLPAGTDPRRRRRRRRRLRRLPRRDLRSGISLSISRRLGIFSDVRDVSHCLVTQ
jgi:hypothetical protein